MEEFEKFWSSLNVPEDARWIAERAWNAAIKIASDDFASMEGTDYSVGRYYTVNESERP